MCIRDSDNKGHSQQRGVFVLLREMLLPDMGHVLPAICDWNNISENRCPALCLRRQVRLLVHKELPCPKKFYHPTPLLNHRWSTTLVKTKHLLFPLFDRKYSLLKGCKSMPSAYYSCLLYTSDAADDLTR